MTLSIRFGPENKPMCDEATALHFFNEAIVHLGYIKAKRIHYLATFFQEISFIDSRKVSLQVRKQDPQLTINQKRELGISKRAFFSLAALEDLTEKGLQDPLHAHEITFRRAAFNVNRYTTIQRHQKQGFCNFELKAAKPSCSACNALDGTTIGLKQLRIGNLSECKEEACQIQVSPKYL
ncbi:hypothetical protein ACQU0X_22250 [Pseudovibrio ascidiaceicola]|uniref:hypothetical protein n=1 Tax=Pseudovibrio ascidiaceicola TaxID=285279 RepID=UPI003D35ADE7